MNLQARHTKVKLTIVLICITICNTEFAAEQNEQWLTIDDRTIYSFNWKGKEFNIDISENELRAKSQWEEDPTSNPPLSVSNACSIASEHVRKVQVEYKTSLVLVSVEIRRHKNTSCWYYLLQYRSKELERRDRNSDYYHVIVLMSGILLNSRTL